MTRWQILRGYHTYYRAKIQTTTNSGSSAFGKRSTTSCRPGDAPSIVLTWAVEAVAKAGTVSIIGVYGAMHSFPIGDAMEKNLTLTMGNCNHRRYIPHLVELVRSGSLDPAEILTQREPMTSVIDAYKAFDKREPGWIKVKLEPSAESSLAA